MVTVHIDRSLGLCTVLHLPPGSTVSDAREQLARDDPTGQTSAKDIVLRLLESPGGGAGGRLVQEAECLDSLTGDLELVPAQEAAPTTSPSASGTALADSQPATTTKASPTTSPCAYGAAPADSQSTTTAKAGPDALNSSAVSALLAKATKALDASADFDLANQALGSLTPALRNKGTRPKLLMARGLVFWRWSRLDRALRDLEDAHRMEAAGAGLALLALQLCLSRWPEAHRLAQQLGETEAVGLVDGWITGMDASKGSFAPSDAKFVEEAKEVMPGYRQMDARVPVAEEVELGVRLLLQLSSVGKAPLTKRPLVLYFHGNAETVDSYIDPEIFNPIREAGASALVADFRGYGFSKGGTGPSLAWLHVDAERLCEELPPLFTRWKLPWPWPGGLYLLGRSLGSRIACHLTGIRSELFTGGVVLDSAMCGSHAPGAEPPPEPPADASPLGGGGAVKRFHSDEMEAAIRGFGKYCQTLVARATGHTLDLSHFVHVAGNEDKIRGFDGRLLILHGEIDTIIPPSHARRLLDAAESATRRLVTVGKGHNDLSFHPKYVEALKTFLAGR